MQLFLYGIRKRRITQNGRKRRINRRIKAWESSRSGRGPSTITELPLRKRLRQREAERKRWWKRHFKRAAWKKYGRLRLMTSTLFLITVIYLGAAGHWKDRLFRERETISVELHGNTPGTRERLWRIVFHLKTGELVIYREDERVDEQSDESADLDETEKTAESEKTVKSEDSAESENAALRGRKRLEGH